MCQPPGSLLKQLIGKSFLIYGTTPHATLLSKLLLECGSKVHHVTQEDFPICATSKAHDLGCLLPFYHAFVFYSTSKPLGICEIDSYESYYYSDIIIPFEIARHLVSSQLSRDNSIPPVLFGISFMGGSYGRLNPPQRLLEHGGAYTGMLKCFKKEYPEIQIKTIDFDHQVESEFQAQSILTELLSNSLSEVGYHQNNRFEYSCISSSDTHTSNELVTPSLIDTNSVILCFGGARGIAFECLTAIAHLQPLIILTGRSEIDGDDLDFPEGITESDLKAALIKKYQSTLRNQDNPITPAQINQRVSRILDSRQTKLNLAKLIALGARVEYFSLDVSDVKRTQELINDIYARHSSITGIIHAAGVLRDQRIVNKSIESFSSVLGTKLHPLLALPGCLRSVDLRFIVFFSSVAGRFGNSGQVDYAVANEILNRGALYLKKEFPSVVVKSICWGPWDSSGMASDYVKAQFRNEGIEPIITDDGVSFLMNELKIKDKSSVEVIAGKGPWIEHETQELCYKSQTILAHSSHFYPDPDVRFDFLGSSVSNNSPGKYSCLLDINAELLTYLPDHAIDGKHVLPALGAVALLTDLATSIYPSLTLLEISNVNVYKGIVLPSTYQGLPVALSISHQTLPTSPNVSLVASIEDPDSGRLYYKCELIYGSSRPLKCREITGAPFVPTTTNVVDSPYQYLFHGPFFQVIRNIIDVTARSITAIICLSEKHRRPQHDVSTSFPSIPLMDSVPQLAIIWARLNLNATALPSSIHSIQLIRQPPSSTLYMVSLFITEVSPHLITYDATILDETGQVIAINSFKAAYSSSLNRISGHS